MKRANLMLLVCLNLCVNQMQAMEGRTSEVKMSENKENIKLTTDQNAQHVQKAEPKSNASKSVQPEVKTNGTEKSTTKSLTPTSLWNSASSYASKMSKSFNDMFTSSSKKSSNTLKLTDNNSANSSVKSNNSDKLKNETQQNPKDNLKIVKTEKQDSSSTNKETLHLNDGSSAKSPLVELNSKNSNLSAYEIESYNTTLAHYNRQVIENSTHPIDIKNKNDNKKYLDVLQEKSGNKGLTQEQQDAFNTRKANFTSKAKPMTLEEYQASLV